MTDEEFIPDEVRPGRRSRYRFTRNPQWVLLHPELSDAGYRAYCLLLAHVNTERGDGAVWPRQKSLGAMLSKRPEAMSRVINKELVPLGLVDVDTVRYGSNNTRRRNIYTVHEEPPAGWNGFATIQEWYAANDPRKSGVAGQSGHAINRASEDAIDRASGDAKNRAVNKTNLEQDEVLEQDGAPTARSAGDARRAPDRSSARGTQGGSAAANDKRKSSRNRLTPEQAKAVAVVEQALPETLTELLPHRQLTNAVRELIARELANRTPEQLAGRVARRWFFHGYQRAVLAGEGLRRPVAVAHALVRPGECTDASCEDGVLIDTGADCRSCQERRENRRRNGGTGPVPAQRSGGRDGWVCRACERPGRGEAPESGECSRCWAEARDAVRRLLDAPAPAPQEDPEEIAEQAVGGSEEAPGSADTPEAPEDAEQAAERIRDREETERLKAQIAAQNPGLAEIARKANH